MNLRRWGSTRLIAGRGGGSGEASTGSGRGIPTAADGIYLGVVCLPGASPLGVALASPLQRERASHRSPDA